MMDLPLTLQWRVDSHVQPGKESKLIVDNEWNKLVILPNFLLYQVKGCIPRWFVFVILIFVDILFNIIWHRIIIQKRLMINPFF